MQRVSVQNANHWAIQDSNLKSQSTSCKTLNENQQNQKVHNLAHLLTIYPELERIITAWPQLAEDIKKTNT